MAGRGKPQPHTNRLASQRMTRQMGRRQLEEQLPGVQRVLLGMLDRVLAQIDVQIGPEKVTDRWLFDVTYFSD